MLTARQPIEFVKTLSKLSLYECPFTPVSNRCPNESTCPFGSHSLKPQTTRSPSGAASLLLFPSTYVCYAYLIGECTEDAEALNHGLHLDDIDELTDVPQLKRKYYMADVERHLAQPRKKRTDPPEKEAQVHSCPICLEEITPRKSQSPNVFAIQEKCTHIFCSECLRMWRQTNRSTKREFSCPLCRTISELMVTVKELPTNAFEKAYLFDCQKQLRRPTVY